jgi:serine/threonine-protein phosphatase 2B catalytic subunit
VDSETGEAEEEFALNEVRGCSYNYSASAVKKFLQQNELLSIIRAHEAQIDGYKLHKWDGSRDFPVVITVFSAPNYCDVYHNKGAIIKLDNDTLTIEQYGYTEHPYLLPNFMDVFTWSVPFVTEKVLEIFACIMRTPRNFVDMGAEEPSNQTDAD